MAVTTAPSELARETLRQLAARRLAPTPDNYGRVYRELAGQPAPEESALDERESGRFLREQLAKVLTDAVIPRLGYKEDLAHEARAIAEGLRSASVAGLRDPGRGAPAVLDPPRAARRDDRPALQRARPAAARGTFSSASFRRRALAQAATGKGRRQLWRSARPGEMREAERDLRGVIFRQGALRKVSTNRRALKQMVAVFIERLGVLSHSTGNTPRASAVAKRSSRRRICRA